ncbi:MAG: geranylgeranylglycerol-phosphate geranylgeranyltransferase [Paludibacter sp.]
MNFLKLIRVQNLLFIAFIQLMMRQVVLLPILQKYGFEIARDHTYLILLIIATVFIAAGGYVLNDYFDVKIDAINRPKRLIVGKDISKRTAMLLHQILTGVGTLTGLVLAYSTRSFTLAFIFIVVPGLLWFYSASYKRQFLTGNLIVSFVAALTVLVVAIAELAVLQKEFGGLVYETPIPAEFYGWMGGFAIFSFLTTWIREIIKDMEDEHGDREMECRTMPIKWGLKKTKIFVYFLIVVTISALLFADYFLIDFEGSLTLRFVLVGLALPLIILIYLISVAKTPYQFHQASTLVKFIMLVGVLYSLVFYYLMAKTYGFSLFDLFMVK